MENGQGTGAKLGLPPLTPEQQEALQRVCRRSTYFLEFDQSMCYLAFCLAYLTLPYNVTVPPGKEICDGTEH